MREWRSTIASLFGGDGAGFARSVVTDAEGHVTTTRYWPDGKVWKVIDAKGNNAVVNRYYGDGSLKEVEDAEGNITTYEYNGFKGLARTTYEEFRGHHTNWSEFREFRGHHTNWNSWCWSNNAFPTAECCI